MFKVSTFIAFWFFHSRKKKKIIQKLQVEKTLHSKPTHKGRIKTDENSLSQCSHLPRKKRIRTDPSCFGGDVLEAYPIRTNQGAVSGTWHGTSAQQQDGTSNLKPFQRAHDRLKLNKSALWNHDIISCDSVDFLFLVSGGFLKRRHGLKFRNFLLIRNIFLLPWN